MERLSAITDMAEEQMAVKLLEDTASKRLDKRIHRTEKGKDILNTLKDVRAVSNCAILIDLKTNDEVEQEDGTQENPFFGEDINDSKNMRSVLCQPEYDSTDLKRIEFNID